MASNAKKKTTFAKLKREQDVRERRERKQARREARRHAPPTPPPALETGAAELGVDGDAELEVAPEPGAEGEPGR